MKKLAYLIEARRENMVNRGVMVATFEKFSGKTLLLKAEAFLTLDFFSIYPSDGNMVEVCYYEYNNSTPIMNEIFPIQDLEIPVNMLILLGEDVFSIQTLEKIPYKESYDTDIKKYKTELGFAKKQE